MPSPSKKVNRSSQNNTVKEIDQELKQLAQDVLRLKKKVALFQTARQTRQDDQIAKKLISKIKK